MTPHADKRVLIVSPVRNEADHIVRTAQALAAQTRPPDLWIVVDDGSTDATPDILAELVAEIEFMRVLRTPAGHTPPGIDRHALAASARAFNWALRDVDVTTFSHIGKLDGDIELTPDYFERLLDRFAADATLGIAGGVLIEPHGDRWRIARVPSNHVRGALKLYSRACLAAIGGIREQLGWDTIDETYARMLGFQTHSFDDLVVRHHRPVATVDGRLRGRARHGRAAYVLHYSFPWVLMRSFKAALAPPLGLSGIAFLFGYVAASLRRLPRVDDERFRRFVRAELRARIAAGLVGRRLRDS